MLALKDLETRFKVQKYNARTDVTVNINFYKFHAQWFH